MNLRIEGAVDHPSDLGFDALRAMSGQIADVSGLVAGRSGAAVRLAVVLSAAGVRPAADYVTVEADDGSFAASVPLEAVSDAVLVYRVGEEPLPRDRGGSVRLLIPDAARCGRAEVDTCANVKHVARIRLDVGRGRDTRPTTREEHAAVHGKPDSKR